MVFLEQPELDRIYQFAIETAKGAGKLLLDGVEERCRGGDLGEQREKLNSVDLVTQKDEGTASGVVMMIPMTHTTPNVLS